MHSYTTAFFVVVLRYEWWCEILDKLRTCFSTHVQEFVELHCHRASRIGIVHEGVVVVDIPEHHASWGSLLFALSSPCLSNVFRPDEHRFASGCTPRKANNKLRLVQYQTPVPWNFQFRHLHKAATLQE